MQILLELPNTPALTGFDPLYLKQALVATLYHLGKLSEQEACVALNLSRREFEDLLPKFGFSVLSDTQGSIDIESNAVTDSVVADTGPLISLEKLTDGYALIRQLYSTPIVPPAVLAELAQGRFPQPNDYIQHYTLADLIDIHPVVVSHPALFSGRLHPGETQAIQLALQLNLPLLIEATIGRSMAQSLGIHISGIAGQVVKAYRTGVISKPDAHRLLGELCQAGRINRKIHTALLAAI